MADKISKWLISISRGPVVLACLLVMILFMVLVLPGQAQKSQLETGGAQSPDTSFFYTAADLYQMAEDYGPSGRESYIRARWTFDLVFPLIYVSFLVTGISWLSTKLASGKDIWSRANLLPLLGGLFDYLENGATSWVMAVYPDRLPGLAELASSFTLVKWLLICLAFLAYLGLGVGTLITWIQGRSD